MSTSGLRSEEVQSAVEIEHSRGVVRHDLAVGRIKHTRVCIATVLGALKFTEQGTQFILTNVRVTPLRVAIMGADGSFGLHIHAAVSARAAAHAATGEPGVSPTALVVSGPVVIGGK